MTEQPKKKEPTSTQKKVAIGAIVIFVLSLLGINVYDYLDVDSTPDPQVPVLQTAMAEAENDYLELNDKYNHQVDENDVLDAQNLSLAATVAAYESVVTPPPDVTPPPPDPTATIAPPTLPPPPASQIVKVTADKVVSHYIKSLNKKGFPIMLPDDKDDREKWVTGEKIEVKLTAIKGDGDSYWYEILDFEGHYIDADKVVVK